MDIFTSLDLGTIGFVALATFGAVAVVNFKWHLTPMQNFFLSIPFAFLFGFVPVDFGNIIMNRLRDAVAVATGLNGAYQFLSGLAKKMGQDS